MDDPKTLIKPYLGKTWRTAPAAASIFDHAPAALTVRFFAAKALKEHLVEAFEDELAFQLKCAEDGEWADDSLTPIAAIGYATAGDEDDEEFVTSAFAYLFHDGDRQAIVYATSDSWSRENTLDDGLAQLGLA